MSKTKSASTALNYTAALTELKNIVDAIERGDVNIDGLTMQLERANFLVNFCQEKLRGIENSIAQNAME